MTAFANVVVILFTEKVQRDGHLHRDFTFDDSID